MVIYEYPFSEKVNIPGCVLALGFFDGVHIAHRDLILSAREIAKEKGLKLGIFSFKSSGNIKSRSERLYDDQQKAEIFSVLGADFTIFADFGAISHYSPSEFVSRVLIEELNCHIAVAGFNFRFGKGALGGAEDLALLMKEGGGNAVIRQEIICDSGITLSATVIRDLISNGEIKKAEEYLGAPYYIKGRVSSGRKVGREMGFPTANVDIEPGFVIPKSGVYRCAVPYEGKIYSAVVNIGECPTFEKRRVHLEAHLIDFDGDLYGKEIRIFLLDFIRAEETFTDIESLKSQIEEDKNKVINENGDISWQDLGLK